MPPLFSSVRPTSLIPPLCRQSQVLQLAYSHAMIHVTRSFLLNDFTDLSRRPQIPHPTVTNILQKCIGAAEHVITLVDSLAKQGVMIQSFWFTHYVCFCAIIVVYIYTIQQHRSSSPSAFLPQSTEDSSRFHDLFNLAEACQQHLAEATRKNCPSRRYSIILEELRREVHKQIGFPLPSSTPVNAQIQEASLGQDQFLFSNVDQSMPLGSNVLDYAPPSQSFQATDLGDTQFGPMEDIGLLESLEGSNWWAQLDSWVSTLLLNLPSNVDVTVLTYFFLCRLSQILPTTHPCLCIDSRSMALMYDTQHDLFDSAATPNRSQYRNIHKGI